MEEIKKVEEDWVLNITSTFKNASLTFKIGEEFDEVTMDGRRCKVCYMFHCVLIIISAFYCLQISVPIYRFIRTRLSENNIS